MATVPVPLPVDEKPSSLSSDSSSALSFFTSNAIVARFSDALTSLSERREALGLSNPGSVEKLSREVDYDVFLTNQSFSGLRAEIAKSFSMSPMFQVSHSLAMGSQALSPYNFAAMYGSPRVCLLIYCSLPMSEWSANGDVYRYSAKAPSTTSSPSPAASTTAGPRAS